VGSQPIRCPVPCRVVPEQQVVRRFSSAQGLCGEKARMRACARACESPCASLLWNTKRQLGGAGYLTPSGNTLRADAAAAAEGQGGGGGTSEAGAERPPVIPPAFWEDEETRFALEKLACKRARNTRWHELARRRARLAIHDGGAGACGSGVGRALTQRAILPPLAAASPPPSLPPLAGREVDTLRGKLVWPEDEVMLSFGRCDADDGPPMAHGGAASSSSCGAAASKGVTLRIPPAYQAKLAAFVHEHADAFLLLEFAECVGEQAESLPRLLPTLVALDGSGARIECGQPPRVHIQGW
jgi:hypothetical protein